VPKGTPTRVLSIHLLKESVNESDLIDPEKKPRKRKFKFGPSSTGTLYAGESFVHEPRWASFIKEGVDISGLDFRSASSSAVVVVPIKKRLVAVTFGYGRFLLRPDAIEPNFGLRATLNSVAGDRIRSIDKKTFEGIATHTREQASRETSMGDFGIDVERDVLRAVVGSPNDESLAVRMAGMDSLTATCRLSFADLPGKLEQFVDKSQEGTYKTAYPWIDNISEIRDSVTRKKLDDQVLSSIKTGSLSGIWLAIPDPIEWTDVAGMRYSSADRDAALLVDIHVNTFLGTVGDASTLTIDDLHHRTVSIVSSTSESVIQKWSVYKCVYAEVELGGATYLLNNGQWYRIDNDFVSTVNAHVASLQETDGPLLLCKDGESEADYNVRLAGSLVGACCLDRKLVPYGGGRSTIEFCDVLTSDRRMMHVKKYTGSSVLSHLFAQGTVAATSLLSDEKFRAAVNKIISVASMRFTPVAKKVRASDHEVAYVVASRSSKKLTLPFFSRVTLRNASTQLANYGFKVTLTKVKVD
jgi:uncharacterized protein (TIGR04141 family)